VTAIVWVLAVLVVLTQLGKVLSVGEYREPLTGGQVALDLVINGFLVFVLLRLAGQV
jgi:hypothetical protein